MIKKLAFLEIVVADFPRALDWYTKIMGFEVDGEEVENESGRWCQLKTQSGDNRLALWKPSWTPGQEKALYSFIPVFEVDNLEQLVACLKAKKVLFLEGIRQMPSYRITTIVDPERNRLQLFEPIP
jgi:predicted enzyme related to lactoylglutathione lyase